MSALRAAHVLVAALESPDARVRLRAAIAILDLAGVGGREVERCEHVPATVAQVLRLELARPMAPALRVAA